MDVPKQELLSLMASLLKDFGLTLTTKFDVQPIQARLWLSNAFKVKIYLEDSEELSLFVKALPADQLRKEVFDSPAFFRNEVAVYSGVLTSFFAFQKKRIEDESRLFDSVPKCYSARSDGQNDVIILEDLQAKGFVMPNRLEVMCLPNLHLLMKELGRFHALSLAMKDQEPEEFGKLKNLVEETVFNERFLGKMGKGMFMDTFDNIMILVKETYSADSVYAVKMDKFFNSLLDVLKEQVHGHVQNEPFNVITHGDMWVNNLLFKFSDDQLSTPEKMCFIDFQQSRYCSLAVDVSSVLFMCADGKIREEHRDDLLRSYHTSLCDFLADLGSDPEKVFPFECLEKQLGKYSLYALANAIVNLPQALDIHEGGVEEMALLEKIGDGNLEVDQIIDILIPVLEKSYNRKTEECKKRLLDVITEAVDRGYLDSIPD